MSGPAISVAISLDPDSFGGTVSVSIELRDHTGMDRKVSGQAISVSILLYQYI